MQLRKSVLPLEGKLGSVHRTAGDQTQSPAGHPAVLVKAELLVANIMAFPMVAYWLWIHGEHFSCAFIEAIVLEALQMRQMATGLLRALHHDLMVS